MKKIRTLILDHDAETRELLRDWLQREPDVELVGVAGGTSDLGNLWETARPDLVVLDTVLSRGQGPAAWPRLCQKPRPAVIVVAARPEHTLEAFDLGLDVVDCFLRPLQATRLQKAVQRAREHLGRRPQTAGAGGGGKPTTVAGDPAPPTYLTRLTLKTSDRLRYIRVDDLEWVEAADNYVILHVQGQTFMVRGPLATLESSLDPSQFVRISRSALVNVNAIAELRPVCDGEHVVCLRDGKRLRMTRGLAALQTLLETRQTSQAFSG